MADLINKIKITRYWRAFYFFDPTSFSGQLSSDLNRWTEKATYKGPFFTHPAFQIYYHKNAMVALNGFVGLSKVALSEDQLKGEPLANLVTSIISSYTNYIHQKKLIPTKSKWFAHTSKYKNWYLSSEFYVHIAALAKSELIPSKEPDHQWLENGIEDIEVEALRYSIRVESHGTTNALLGSVFSQFTELGKSGNIHLALKFHSKIENALLVELEKELPPLHEINFEINDELQVIGAADILCSSIITLVAGFFSTIDDLDIEKVINFIEGHNWEKPDAPYTLGLPSAVLPEVEDISQRLAFELKVEDRKVTPDWYITELIVRRICFYVVDAISSLLVEGISFINKWVEIYENEHQVLKTIVVIDRGLELSEKLKTLIRNGNDLINKFYPLKYLDLSWPDWNYEEKKQSIDTFSKNLITRLASHLVELSTLKRVEKIPDYFGKAIVLIGYECFYALDRNDSAYFQSIFPEFFVGCLLTYENMKKTTVDWNSTRRLIALSEPLIDLFFISGFALLYSELHQDQQLWIVCKTSWENYLRTDPKNRLSTFNAIYIFRKSYPVITERDNARTYLENAFSQRLRALPTKTVPTNDIFGKYTVIDHPSEIISVISRRERILIGLYKPDEIFVDQFINKHYSEQGIIKLHNPISEALDHHRKRKTVEKREIRRNLDEA